MNSREFKALQKHWYSVLRDDGFEDIEELKGRQLVISQSCSSRFARLPEHIKQARIEYFNQILYFIYSENKTFRNEVHRYILMRYAEGARNKTIVQELKSRNTPLTRVAVRIIIRKYEMKWGIRSYTRKQLGLFEKEKV